MEVELCTCPVGHTGAPCKHQAAVVQNFGCFSSNFLPTTPEMRAEHFKITSGANISLEFLQPLRDKNQPRGKSDTGNMPVLNKMLDDLNRLSIDDNFSEALVAMAKQFNAIKGNPSRLLSAIHCFGKSHISPVANSAAALRSAARRPGSMIPCQPTAVACRSTKAGMERISLTVGYNTKSLPVRLSGPPRFLPSVCLGNVLLLRAERIDREVGMRSWGRELRGMTALKGPSLVTALPRTSIKSL
ncbi:hypothetical protein J4Q44_G00007290 [Coregonus suidteri]|uniref:SWIM-type domain-containing protein n=1 Tax=Coregonus suidteri TaxID=861788 RepID=A0AAN8MK84_9TELE